MAPGTAPFSPIPDTGDRPASPGSSASSNSSAPAPGFSLRPPQPSRTTTGASTSSSQTRITPVDALSRQYPAPTHEASVEEMLARPPQRWSLGHYVKNAREAKTPVPDREQQVREFADVKRQLLEDRERMQQRAL